MHTCLCEDVGSLGTVHGGACNAIIQEAQTHSEPVSKKEKERVQNKNPQTTTKKQSVKLKWTARVMGSVSSPSWLKPSITEIKKTNRGVGGGHRQ